MIFSSPQRSLILAVYSYTLIPALITVRVQLLSCVRHFGTPWTAGQASLSFTHCRNLLKFMFVESVMVSNHLNLCRPLLLWSFPASGFFGFFFLHFVFLYIFLFFNFTILYWFCQLFTSDGQSTGSSTSSSVLPMNIWGYLL